MSMEKETAGKTAEGAATRTGNRARVRKAGAKGKRRNALRDRIGRTRYALLRRMADAMNSVGWAENDNTPETTWKEFLLWRERPAYWGYTLVETIDTGADNFADEIMRKRELTDALTRRGVKVAQYIGN